MSSISSNCKNVDRMHSLKELCKKALIAHIDRLRYMGTVPQYLVADVLAHCTVDQLETLEHYNPHIRTDNEGLWMSHCARKYKELAELQTNIAEGLAAPTKPWREMYWEMKRQDELRAQAIMDKVRLRTAEMEREKNARKIQITNKIPKKPAVSRAISSSSAQNRQRHSINSKNMSLMQRARMITRTQLSMIGKFQKSNHRPAVASSPPPPTSLHVCQISPAGSPGYSPPYLSSASPCSPPHSSGYSPPYVPETDGMGSNSYGRLSPTVSVKTKTPPNKRSLEESTPTTEAKKRRRRQEQHDDDADKHQNKKKPNPAAVATTESFFQVLAGNDDV